MMDYLPRVGPAAIADLLLLQRGAWIVVVFREEELEDSLKRIKTELDFLLGEDQDGKGSAHVVDAAASSSEVLATLGRYSEDDVVLLTGIERFLADELERFDLLRNKALYGPRVLIATPQGGADRLSTHSPNLWSWLGAHCMQYDASEGRMDVEERLQSLRDHFQLSDLQVIELAARGGELPDDVAFTEWLILLGRGDLLGT
jgi:hypothetical protein